LFVLFFTEMWERFSFYGMRVLLFNFLIFPLISPRPGWEWPAENAGPLFAAYAGLLYLTPIAGGYLADRFLGYRNSVAIGALIMTAGHGCMAMDTVFSLYLGLTLLVIGTGFFKPTMTSIISEMYKDLPEKKDGAYTIFYMGVNAGAFFGMMMCGYLAETLGWSWGFGLAGIFMFLGLLQFWFAKPIFGDLADGRKGKRVDPVAEISSEETIDDAPKSSEVKEGSEKDLTKSSKNPNPYTLTDKILVAATSMIALIYMLHTPFAVEGMPLIPKSFDIIGQGLNEAGEPIVALSGKYLLLLIGLVLFLFLVISRISRYEKIVRNRMIAFVIFAFFTVFFWMAFEQGATSLPLFAREFTERVLEGGAATAYRTFVPLIIISWVLVRLWVATKRRIQLSNIILAISFLGVWGIACWKVNRELSNKTYEVQYAAIQTAILDADGNQKMEDGKLQYSYPPVTPTYVENPDAVIVNHVAKVTDQQAFKTNQEILLLEEDDRFIFIDTEADKKLREQIKKYDRIYPAFTGRVIRLDNNTNVEVPWTWFSILNSFFIIAFASFFSKLWESKYNVPPAFKYGLGLIIMAIGFGCLAYGATGIGEDASGNIIRVSMIWLVLAYLFHTLGELCLSPVGLSYVSKLVPARMIGFMFGMWYLAIAIGNTAAAQLGGMIEVIAEDYSMPTFFLIFTIVPVAAGVLIMVLHPLIKRLMSGAE